MLEGYSNPQTIPPCFTRTIAALWCTLVFTVAAARAEQPFLTRDETSSAAWWVTAEFHPFTTAVRGIPAHKIRKSWCKATELRKDLTLSPSPFRRGKHSWLPAMLICRYKGEHIPSPFGRAG